MVILDCIGTIGLHGKNFTRIIYSTPAFIKKCVYCAIMIEQCTVYCNDHYHSHNVHVYTCR